MWEPAHIQGASDKRGYWGDDDWHIALGDLKCSACGRVTTHALLARASDERTVTALCGDAMTVHSSPHVNDEDETPSTSTHQVPGDVDWDTEFEDHATGMWWVDMDCVNCPRVANEHRQALRRELLETLLEWFTRHPESIPDNDADALIDIPEPLAQTLRAGVSPAEPSPAPAALTGGRGRTMLSVGVVGQPRYPNEHEQQAYEAAMQLEAGAIASPAATSLLRERLVRG